MISKADVARVLAEFRPGLSVYLQGATGEPLVLRDILAGAPEALRGVSLTACLLPAYRATRADPMMAIRSD